MASDDEPASSDAAVTASLRSTAKWVVGACASAAAVIVAGLKFTSLDKLGEAEWWWGVLALGTAMIAIGATFVIIYLAVKVLTTPRPTIDELDQLDRLDNTHHPTQRVKDPTDPLLLYLIIGRGAELLGPGCNSIASLVDDTTAVRKALIGGQDVTIQGRQYDPSVPADVVALQLLGTDLRLRMRTVSDAAERFNTDKSFRTLKRRLVLYGSIFAFSIAGFAWLTILYPAHWIPKTSAITDPIQVEIWVPSAEAARHAGLEQACVQQTLSGVDVGGTLSRPIVVTRRLGECQAHRLTHTEDLVIAPVPLQVPKPTAVTMTVNEYDDMRRGQPSDLGGSSDPRR